MIFLSHSSKDKSIVEPIALRLRKVFGEDNVFYDSWSIKPGDGIVYKMNEGLERCRFCFYFVSSNSLNSFMVELEWQNVLMKSAKEKVKLIPVRIDACEMPAILTQNLYIDYYTLGPNETVRKIEDCIYGNPNFRPQYPVDKNIQAFTIPPYGKSILVKIEAKHHLVHHTKFAFLSTSSIEEVTYDTKGLLYREGGYKKDFMTIESLGITLNAFMLDFKQPLEPGFPLYAEFKTKVGTPIAITFIYHEISEGKWEAIDVNMPHPIYSVVNS